MNTTLSGTELDTPGVQALRLAWAGWVKALLAQNPGITIPTIPATTGWEFDVWDTVSEVLLTV